jgi:hypothetical protein
MSPSEDNSEEMKFLRAAQSPYLVLDGHIFVEYDKKRYFLILNIL